MSSNWAGAPYLPVWKPAFKIGQKVQVHFEEGDFKEGWYNGRIQDQDYDTETYTVAWDTQGWEPTDGIVESDIRARGKKGGARRGTRRGRRATRKGRGHGRKTRGRRV